MFRDLNQYAESKDAYRDLAGYVEVPEQTDSPEQATDPTETKQDDADIVLPSVDFEAQSERTEAPTAVLFGEVLLYFPFLK